MRVLITGGSGFIGRYLFEQLVAGGHSVTILDLVSPTWDARGVRVLEGDVRDLGSVQAALAQCDAVFHLAAAHHDYGIAREEYFAVNETGSSVVCRAMDERRVKKACFLSTVAVYGNAPEPHDEDSPTNPTTPYGQSKLAAEVVFQRWAAQGDGRSALIIRPTATFGPRNLANMYTLIRQIHSGLYLRVGSGTNVKSLAYVENLAAAVLMLWQRDQARPFAVYNYVDKPDLTSREIVDAIYVSLGRKPPSFGVPLAIARVLALPFDLASAVTGRNLPISSFRIRKLASDQTRFEAAKVQAAGFRAPVSLREGIARMVDWYVKEGRAQRPSGPRGSRSVPGGSRSTGDG